MRAVDEQSSAAVPTVLVERDGPVLVITLNRPAKRNAIDPAMAAAIEAAVDELEADPALGVGMLTAVVTPDRPVFCAGHDLAHFRANFGTAEEYAVSTARGGFAGLTERPRGKPLVAAVRGLATAGGWEMVLACDIVIASHQASFALPEVRWNLIAAGGAGVLVPRAVGRYVAADLMLTGEQITADRAHQLGLVSRLVEDQDVESTARQVAHTIAGHAPRAIELSRVIAATAASLGEAEGWGLLEHGLAQLRGSDDLREGLAAFLEKRDPHWTGH